MAAGGGGVGLAEAAEQLRQELRRDAVAVVAHVHHVLPVLLPQHDLDPALDRGELDGVGQQVPQHLLQPRGIAQHRARRPRHIDHQRLRLVLRRQLLQAHGLAHLLGKVEHLDLQLHLAQQHAAQVEHVRHQPLLRQRAAGDDLHPAAHGMVGLHALQQQFAPAQDGGQRGAQFVRQGGEELVLDPGHALGGAACGTLGAQQLLARHLDLAALGDVRAVAGQADEAAIGREARRGVHLQPPPLAVMAAQARAQVQFALVAQRVLQCVLEDLQVLRVQQPLPPARPEAVVGLQAEEAAEGIVDETYVAQVIQYPDRHRQAVGQGAEARLAFGQLGLDLLAPRDVDEQHREPPRRRRPQPHRLDRVPAPELWQVTLELRRHALVDHPPEHPEPVLVQPRQHLGGAAPGDTGQPGDALEGRVHPAVQEVHRAGLVEQHLDHAEAGTGGLEHLLVQRRAVQPRRDLRRRNERLQFGWMRAQGG